MSCEKTASVPPTLGFQPFPLSCTEISPSTPVPPLVLALGGRRLLTYGRCVLRVTCGSYFPPPGPPPARRTNCEQCAVVIVARMSSSFAVFISQCRPVKRSPHVMATAVSRGPLQLQIAEESEAPGTCGGRR
ncbi:Hypothetical protein SMAX5B_003713 [Scophthalmus maximus]|uniref:Uncharacterized protein n=1 Tax=Scophthalmus maximus TaxID=52904 RepID=A0A2U9CFZ6_SCOMX|nr:Hypothetical protein SMAX5B_003713 [Scophthalmus maximus]